MYSCTALPYARLYCVHAQALCCPIDLPGERLNRAAAMSEAASLTQNQYATAVWSGHRRTQGWHPRSHRVRDHTITIETNCCTLALGSPRKHLIRYDTSPQTNTLYVTLHNIRDAMATGYSTTRSFRTAKPPLATNLGAPTEFISFWRHRAIVRRATTKIVVSTRPYTVLLSKVLE